MKLTGVILLISVASAVLAENREDRDYYYKSCRDFGTIRGQCEAGWEVHRISDVAGPCECRKAKSPAQKKKEREERCAYYEGLCYKDGRNYKESSTYGEGTCGRLYTCNYRKYHDFCRKAYIEEWTYQCPKQLTRKEIAEIKAEKAAAAKKKQEEEAAGEIEGKKAYCAIIKPHCYKEARNHKNYNDPTSSCNQMKNNCSKAENDKLCADAKKDKWLWQCR